MRGPIARVGGHRVDPRGSTPPLLEGGPAGENELRLVADGRVLGVRAADAGSVERDALEALIRTTFLARYDARVGPLMPDLLGLFDARARPRAAVGLRSGDGQPLFLEQYLDTPLDRVIAERFDARVSRRGLVEVGHLASVGAGLARPFVQALVLWLAAHGTRWVAFTATRQLRSILCRLGLRPFVVCAAAPARLGPAAADWGSYYESEPSVVVGFVPSGLAALEPERFDPEQLRAYQQRAALLAG